MYSSLKPPQVGPKITLCPPAKAFLPAGRCNLADCSTVPGPNYRPSSGLWVPFRSLEGPEDGKQTESWISLVFGFAHICCEYLVRILFIST